MKINKDKKKEVLLSSFEVLKFDFEQNKSKIVEIVAKMVVIDKEIAIDMWKFLILKHKSHLTGSNAWHLSGGIHYYIAEKLGDDSANEIILNNETIKTAVFKDSADIGPSTIGILKDVFLKNDLSLANELLEMIYANKKKEQSFGNILNELIEYIAEKIEQSSNIYGQDKIEFSENGFDILTFWASKVSNKEEKANISVSLLGLTSDEDTE